MIWGWLVNTLQSLGMLGLYTFGLGIVVFLLFLALASLWAWMGRDFFEDVFGVPR